LNLKIISPVILAAFIILFTVLKLTYATHAADVAKIGVIDVQKIIKTTSIGKSAKAELEKIKKNIEADLNKRKTEIEDAKHSVEREVMILDKNALEEKKRELRIMVNDYKAVQQKYRIEFQQHTIRLNRRITKEIIALAEKIGRKGGYYLIIDKQKAGVMYSPEAADITDDILQQFMDLSLE
jgi:outer membrane protein